VKSDKAFVFIAGLLLMMGCLGYIPGISSLATSQELMGKFMIVLFLSIFLIKNIWLRLFLAWCVIRTAPLPIPQTVVPFYTTSFYLVMLQVLSDNLNIARIRGLLNVICLIAIAQVVMMILQYFGAYFCIIPRIWNGNKEIFRLFENTRMPFAITSDPWAYKDYWAGFTGNPNFASSLLGLCFPAFLRKKWCWAIPVLLLGILICGSTQGLIIMAVCSIVYAFMTLGRKKGTIVFLISCVAIVAFAYWKHDLFNITLSNRTHIWSFYIQHLIPTRWIVGWGMGQGKYLWLIALKEMGGRYPWLHSHNEYITLWAELGIIGFGLMMGYFASTMLKFKRLLKLGSKCVIPSFVESACLKPLKSGIVEAKLVFLGMIAGLLSCMVNFTAHLTIGIVFLMYLSMKEYITKGEV
jgi:hypothetical protein